jgi:hypothetical protein
MGPRELLATTHLICDSTGHNVGTKLLLYVAYSVCQTSCKAANIQFKANKYPENKRRIETTVKHKTPVDIALLQTAIFR